MEKLTLTSQSHEIVVNGGCADGAVDLFSYGPEPEESLRAFGSLHIIGHRDNDSTNIAYIVSLVAALARREYYGNPDTPPREAFERMLKKINEVVDEFFATAEANVNIGIFAVAGGTIMVSKLEKFKILLARDGQTIDILNNIGLFSKEHLQKRRFSSIVSGPVQKGDRIIAYYPAKAVTSRERYLKSYFTKLSYPELAAKLDEMGKENPAFATGLVYVDVAETSEPVIRQEAPAVEAAPVAPTAQYAWSPRQAPEQPQTARELEPEPEVPNIIPSEFALGTRRNGIRRWLQRIRFVRLDTRGKAVFLAGAAVLVIGGMLVAKSLLFADPKEQKIRQTVQAARDELSRAQGEQDPARSRQALAHILIALAGPDIAKNTDAHALAAIVLQAMDALDHAQSATLTLAAQMDPKGGQVMLASWSSVSQSFWAITREDDGSLNALHTADGTSGQHTPLGQLRPTSIIPFGQDALVLDAPAQTLIRVRDGTIKTFTIPTQDTIVSAAAYGDNVYILTSATILKITGLDGDAPVTKPWLTNASDLASGSAQLYVDGNIWTLGPDGSLTTYYKGKKANQIEAAVAPSGVWQLSSPEGTQLAVAMTDTERVYLLDAKTGELNRTIKIDTDQPIVQLFAGQDGTFFLITKDNKIWKVQ